MKAEEVRALSTEEIMTNVDDAKEELMNLRFQLATGELTDHTRLSYTRKLIARYYTILKEREIEEEMEGEV
ncbi:MAG: 50S ribosomal protein L29 [Chloroflexota bacterium]|nr:MAG: 50S ribosomal protein L29 [Chloroflexota bacterium]UCF28241.1 MAG: 50S ribosomal protein L29 [Chloroflexota bacterium]